MNSTQMLSRKSRASDGRSIIFPSSLRKNPSSRWIVRNSRSSIFSSFSKLGRIRMASHGVKMKAANSDSIIATEPRIGIGII